MTLHSRVCFVKLTEYIAITLNEKTCLSVCRRRQCPTERGDLLIQSPQREDRIESDISPVQVSNSVDERSGRPDIDQANKIPKTNKKEPQRERIDTLLRERWDSLCSEIPE